MILNMANLQRVVISLLLIVTAGFLFLAQTSSAGKGPKITNKVGSIDDYESRELTSCARFTLTLHTEMRSWAESSLVYTGRLYPRPPRTSALFALEKRALAMKDQRSTG